MVALTPKNKTAGFTLIEIMVTLFISSLVMGGLITAYINQQRTYVSSETVAELQQNLRAAILIMTSEIREAGCDPTEKAGAGIERAEIAEFQFTRDISGHALSDEKADGATDDPDENITFKFKDTDDTDNNGIVDGGGTAEFGRDTGGGPQPIAENIQSVEFAYILKDGTITSTPSASQLNEIRAVQVSMLARASVADIDLVNTRTYTTISGTTWGPFNDKFKRRFASVTIQCRNMGMNDDDI